MGNKAKYEKTDKVTSGGEELWYNRATKSLCIRKDLVYYDRTVFERLRDDHDDHIPEIFDIYDRNGKLIVFEQYIRGMTLDRYVRSRNPDNDELKWIICEVVAALDHLHGPGMRIVHRGVKPETVKLDRNGNVYLVGYNSAKLIKADQKGDADVVAVGKLIKEYLPDDGSLIGIAETAIKGGYDSIGELRKALGIKKKLHPKGYLTPVFAAVFSVLVFGLFIYGLNLEDKVSQVNPASVAGSVIPPIPTVAPATAPPTAPPTAEPTRAHDVTAKELNDGNGRMYSYRGLVEDVMEVTGISEREAMKAVNDLHLDFKEQADNYAHAYMTYYMETYPVDVRNALEDVGFTKLEIDYVMNTTSLESSAQIQGKARDYLYKLASEKTYKRTSDYRQAMRDMGFGKAFIKDAFLSSGGFEIKRLIKKGKVINDDRTVLPKSDSEDEEEET